MHPGVQADVWGTRVLLLQQVRSAVQRQRRSEYVGGRQQRAVSAGDEVRARQRPEGVQGEGNIIADPSIFEECKNKIM